MGFKKPSVNFDCTFEIFSQILITHNYIYICSNTIKQSNAEKIGITFTRNKARFMKIHYSDMQNGHLVRNNESIDSNTYTQHQHRSLAARQSLAQAF